jgi:hypothetical protein
VSQSGKLASGVFTAAAAHTILQRRTPLSFQVLLTQWRRVLGWLPIIICEFVTWHRQKFKKPVIVLPTTEGAKQERIGMRKSVAEWHCEIIASVFAASSG